MDKRLLIGELRPEVLAYLALVAVLALGWLVYLLRRRLRRRAQLQAGRTQRHAPDISAAAPLRTPAPPDSVARPASNTAQNTVPSTALSATLTQAAEQSANDLAWKAASWRGRIFGAQRVIGRSATQTTASAAGVQPTVAPQTAAQPAAVSATAFKSAPNGVSAADFANHLQRASTERALEVEVLKLRKEVAHLRAELADVALGLQQLKTARPVAPAYTEAMTLARQGLSGSEIAVQCGISLGEAELVFSMVHSEEQTRGG
jgi:hypothetical protein